MNKAQLAQIVATVVAVLEASKKPAHKPVSTYKPANKFTPKGKIASDGKTNRQLANEVAVAKAFKAKGLLVTPRVDVMTYGQWQKAGFTVNGGEKGLFVKKVGTLFHSGQVSPTKEISLVTGQPVEASFPA